MAQTTEEWDLWYPKAATGLLFACGRIAGTDVPLLHAALPVLAVTVRDGAGKYSSDITGM